MNTDNLEATVLGTILINPSLFFKVKSQLPAPAFGPKYEKLVNWIFARGQTGERWDVNLASAIDPQAAELIHKATGESLFYEAVGMLRDEFLSRAGKDIIRQYFAQVDEIGINAVIDSINHDFSKIRHSSVEAEVSRADYFLARMKKYHEQLKAGFAGVPTGHRQMDLLLGGWRPKTWNVIAGRPGMGKTTLMAHFALAAAQAGYPVAYFSCGDMSKESIEDKFLSMILGIPFEQINAVNTSPSVTARMDTHGWPALAELPLYVEDGYSNVADIRGRAIELKMKHGIALLITDYVQQMSAPNPKLEGVAAMKEITRACKMMAVEMDIPHISGSQLSRAIESRPLSSRRPRMEDLRESGTVEQDMDLGIGLFRQAHYVHLEQGPGKVYDGNNRDITNMLEAGLMKFRPNMGRAGHRFEFWFHEDRLVDNQPEPYTNGHAVNDDAFPMMEKVAIPAGHGWDGQDNLPF